MGTSQKETSVEDLLDSDDLEFLKSLAKERGVTVGELAKEGIQEVIAERTRPKPARGVLQPFRRR